MCDYFQALSHLKSVVLFFKENIRLPLIWQDISTYELQMFTSNVTGVITTIVLQKGKKVYKGQTLKCHY